MQRIVVGVDGSEGSKRALQWAVREARLRGATVEAVHAWNPPYVAAYPYTTVSFDPGELEADAKHLLDRVMGETDTSGLTVPVERVVAVGGAAQVLLETAKGADLLVVGTRGLGGFAGLLLGSVSHQVVHHAPCTVVIVPAED